MIRAKCGAILEPHILRARAFITRHTLRSYAGGFGSTEATRLLGIPRRRLLTLPRIAALPASQTIRFVNRILATHTRVWTILHLHAVLGVGQLGVSFLALAALDTNQCLSIALLV